MRYNLVLTPSQITLIKECLIRERSKVVSEGQKDSERYVQLTALIDRIFTHDYKIINEKVNHESK